MTPRSVYELTVTAVVFADSIMEADQMQLKPCKGMITSTDIEPIYDAFTKKVRKGWEVCFDVHGHPLSAKRKEGEK